MTGIPGLDRVIRALIAAGLAPSDHELADSLWLAARIAALERERPPPPSEASLETPAGPATAPKREPPRPEEAPAPTAPPAPEQRPPAATLHRDERRTRADGAVPRGGYRSSPFRTPGVPPLPDALAFSRALRALRLRVPSRVERVLDEDETVRLIAEQDLWAPAHRPRPEPWLDLILVVDDFETMVIWRPAIDALESLLRRQGAFRQVRLVRLGEDGEDASAPALRVMDDNGRRSIAPDTLVAGDGQKVVWVLSDCMAPYWTDRRRLWPLLAAWARRIPVALVQMLPRDMWPGTGLEQTPVVNLRAFIAACPSQKLSLDGARLRPGTLTLPVLTLNPHSVRAWAGLILGRSREWSAGVALAPEGPAHMASGPHAAEPVPDMAAAAEQALEDFRAIASPEAQELTAYFAALPLTLPVMRLAQQVLKPGTRLVHLAEVFLGGLIERDDLHLPADERERDPQRIRFEFRFDIRRRLLNTLPDTMVEDVIGALSEVVERRLGRVSDFIALMLDPSAAGKVPLDTDSLPFARVRLHVLRRLGGDYAPLADALEDAISEWHALGGAPAVMPTEPTPFRDRFQDRSGDGPEMIWLPGGSFRMGSPEGVGSDHEHPAHDVTLSHFAAGKYPLTVGEFRRFVEATGYKTEAERGGGAWVWNRGDYEEKKDASWRKPYMEQDDDHPVLCISWNDAKAYCEWLSEVTGQTYGLLTEAQWEHACRAGSETAYCFGDDEKGLEVYAWFGDASASGSTHPVGEKKPNAWDLYDMHGNVWEWCADWYAEDYYRQLADNAAAAGRNTPNDASDAVNGTSKDPSGPESGSNRVVRGGSWNRGAGSCRSACRDGLDPGDRYDALGFRLSRQV